MITDASETRWLAAQHPGKLCAAHPDHPFTAESKAYLLPRGDVVFQQWVDTWLRQTLSDGTYRRISQAALTPPAPDTAGPDGAPDAGAARTGPAGNAPAARPHGPAGP
jgi:ABC-type amino acid transport substrate-binding protein